MIAVMAIAKPTKYALANLALVLVAFAVYRYYTRVMSQPRNGSQAARLILLGIVLYTVVAAVIIARAYLRPGRRDFIGQSAQGSEVGAFGMLGASRLKNVTVQLAVSDAEFAKLQADRRLLLPPERFNMPVHNNDTARVTIAGDIYHRSLQATITQVDGVNRRITLAVREAKRPQASS